MSIHRLVRLSPRLHLREHQTDKSLSAIYLVGSQDPGGPLHIRRALAVYQGQGLRLAGPRPMFRVIPGKVPDRE